VTSRGRGDPPLSWPATAPLSKGFIPAIRQQGIPAGYASWRYPTTWCIYSSRTA